jgi:enterochelin esterase family protein
MNGPYNAPAEATLQPGVTAGKLMDVAVTAKVFPGANRTVQVYIPAGYVERTPAPFMVLQDGPSYVTRFKLPTVLDNMIAKQQLPLMLAIFVPNAGARRSVEYDTLSDAYVRFVLEDVLPAVEAGAPVKLTTDPEGRSAGGHSSGGIAAFTMGWERPDQFRRILTHSGSFVSIRGGDKYPGIVKAAAAKPLRVFMSVGTKDNEPPRWQRGNENLAAAFKEKAYHYRLVIQNEGTHAQSYPASILPESLLWLWRGYPIAGK